MDSDAPLNLSPEKLALLDDLMRRESFSDVTAQPIRPREESGPAPLSFSQQRLWFLDRLVPESAFYNVPMAIPSAYPLNVAALRRSLTEIVRRHEALRTTFSTIDGQPIQVVAEPQPVSLKVVDLSSLPHSEREAKAAELADVEARKPFDLSTGPLLRCTLLRLGVSNHILLLTMHHIVSDGWSIGVLTREMTNLYTSFVVGRPSPLPELPIQYADFAVWQRNRLQGELLETQLDYWRRQLDGVPTLVLPTDRPRPTMQSYRGSSVSTQLSSDLARAVRQLGRREGCTPFMTMLAAFDVLLSRYSGQNDIVVGVPVAGRDWTELEGLIGFFINTLVMRADLSGAPTFRQLLKRVARVATDAYAHQEVPFEKLVDEIQPERDLSRNPIFQVTFQLLSGTANPPAKAPEPTPAARAGARESPSITGQRGTSVFDLGFNMWELPNGSVQGYVEYSSDLFDEETVERMVRHWRRLLESAVSNPDVPVGELAMLDDVERRQLVTQWNQTDVAYPRDASVYELFLEHAERAPDAIAVTCGSQQLTYGQLKARASRLAQRLRRHGAGPGVVIGLGVERSEHLPVCLLGILETGAAYVPLDPMYPAQRLAAMIEDASARVVVTERELLGRFEQVAAQVAPVLICREDVAEEDDGPAETDTAPARTAGGDLAYVMFTSGSTGRPKGACIPHRAIVRLVRDTDYVTLSADDVVAQASSISFDAATFEIWGAMLNGARLTILPRDALLSAETFAEQARDNGLTVIFLTTALFNQLVREEPAIFRPFKCVLWGGEAADPDSVRRVRQLGPPEHLVHVYGPTENTTFSTWYRVEEVPEGATTVPLGHPIANSRCYVLDADGQLCPLGVPGELYLGGEGLALGYLEAPDLTAQKFVDDPFGRSGEKLYRTGDIVRRLSSGDLEFIGRKDNQVKIRGFRVELNEVEALLAAHPRVNDAVVVLREDVRGERRLVAYVVGKGDPTPTVGELRVHVSERLPGHMVPSVFVFLDAFPLTANGKVDRRALPAPDRVRPDIGTEYVAPATPVEEQLARIWQDVLRIERVGGADNFFELGGDSILSIQIIGRAKQAGINLAPRQIFQHQTISELARVAGTSVTIAAEQGAVQGPVLLTPVQRWFFEHDIADPHHFNQAVLFDTGGITGASMLRDSLAVLVAHHDALRLRFERTDDQWRQTNASSETADLLREVDLSHLEGAEQAAALEDACTRVQASIDLEHGPLLRAALFRLGAGQSSRLLIAVHHLAVDGVSWRILLDDLSDVWQQLAKGEPIQLPPKTTSFQAWAERLTQHARTTALTTEVSRWLELAHAAEYAALPLDFPQAVSDADANTVAHANDVVVSLDEDETRRVLQDLPAAHRTQVNDVLITALCTAVTGWTGRTGVLLDLEGHGREAIFDDVDVSRTVGWFTTVFPVFLAAEPGQDRVSLLRSVKEQLHKVPSRGLGYGLLRYLNDDAQVARALRSLPTPQISFNYLGQFGSDPSGLQPDESMRGGAAYSPRGRRLHVVEINGSVQDRRLQFAWTYSERLHRRATIEAVADEFIQALADLARRGSDKK